MVQAIGKVPCLSRRVGNWFSQCFCPQIPRTKGESASFMQPSQILIISSMVGIRKVRWSQHGKSYFYCRDGNRASASYTSSRRKFQPGSKTRPRASQWFSSPRLLRKCEWRLIFHLFGTFGILGFQMTFYWCGLDLAGISVSTGSACTAGTVPTQPCPWGALWKDSSRLKESFELVFRTHHRGGPRLPHKT